MYKLIIIRDDIVYLVCQSRYGTTYLTKICIKDYKLIKKSAKGRHMTALGPMKQQKRCAENIFESFDIKEGEDYILVKKCQPYPKMPIKTQ